MRSILKNIQDIVIKYANVLSEILKVDIEIVDNEFNRIAGTGVFEKKTNNNTASEGYVYKKVIETGQTAIIDNPGNHEICKNCPKRNRCEETYEISTPITLKNKVIGVIGFVCFDEQQKKHILENSDTFLNFSRHISDLISLKAKEEIEKKKELDFRKLLVKIINKIDEGVLLVDENNKILKLNNIAKKILKIDYTNSNIVVELNETGHYTFNKKEYNLKIDNYSYKLVGDIFNMDLEIGYYYKIFIFDDIGTLKERFISGTSSKNNIGLDQILGYTEKIVELKEKVLKIAPSSSTVLITGESGTGKELFARAIYMKSPREKHPFIAVNCAAIPDALLESELFGYVKGAFTGADPKGKIGKIELAHNGTLFLDEIGDMPIYLQAKLLRVLEERVVVRLGSNKSIGIDVKIICATNKNLEKMVEDKTFRKDLFYRLNVIPIEIPPLRERKEDIKPIANYFIDKYSSLFNKRVNNIESNVWKCFYTYNWPGNVRELANTTEYIINMLGYDGVITRDLLPAKILDPSSREEGESLNLKYMEKQYISKAIEIYGNDVQGKELMAEELGIGIATLYRKIKKYHLIFPQNN